MRIVLSSILTILGLIIVFRKHIFKSTNSSGLLNMLKTEKISFLEGLKLRGFDLGGSGSFGAPRNGRVHKGLDITITPKQNVLAPFNGIVNRFGTVYNNDNKYTLVEILGTDKFKGFKCKIMYVAPLVDKLGQKVLQNDLIGIAQDISQKYKTVTPHLHYEVYNDSGQLLDPTQYT